VPGRTNSRQKLDDGTLLGDQDLYLFAEGSHIRLHEKLGAHLARDRDTDGTYFAVWAPNARSVSVSGDFNGWDLKRHPMTARAASGIWEVFIPGVDNGALYKYHIVSSHNRYKVDKADPLAFFSQTPPATASTVWNLDYSWRDGDWLKRRAARNALTAPISIYEMHLGSWRRSPEDPKRLPTYREIAESLPAYLQQTGFTHVEFLPVMEHPYYASWGYQTTGYFAPTSRYGTPQDFMHLVETLHRAGIGVILDWVPSHFPTDEHGPVFFDGTHLYEHADPRQGHHPDWHSAIFNYGRGEVRSFLLSSALFWLERYHADGFRVDAVASMLYLDYSRKAGEWIPNEHGGRENLEAMTFLRRFNEEVFKAFPDVQTIAEESTDWPMVSRPVYLGGLGFGMKWDLGWMHDTLKYLKWDPYFRSFHHQDITFRMMYAYNENFVLPLSHDEVVHGKSPLAGKMPGDEWQKFANLRLLFGYMWAMPGKKLLFMGDEFGSWNEWSHDRGLEWEVLEYETHRGLRDWVGSLNELYRREPTLSSLDYDTNGFEWLDCDDAPHSVLSLMRRGSKPGDVVIAVFNFTPVARYDYRVGVPKRGYWKELLNSDAKTYGGSDVGNMGGTTAVAEHHHTWPAYLSLTLPPLGAVFLKPGRAPKARPA
jgi:1,4-alpha-glucan branching enzyme